MCMSIHKGGGGDLSLKMVENVMGLGHPDKVDQYCSLVNSKRGSVPGLKFHYFALCTIDTHTSNVSLALFFWVLFNCFCCSYLVHRFRDWLAG